MNKYLAVYGKPRYLGIIEFDGEIRNGDTVVVESHRGDEYAVVAGLLTEAQEAEYRKLRSASEHGDGPSKATEPVITDLKYVAAATEEDMDDIDSFRKEEVEILRSAKELLKPHNLDMKLIDVEFLCGKRKLFFYFASEQRVDFRAYVRDLAREFKTRIELRQIGVRDEAKIIRGIGPCGRPCCCSYWLDQFAPICIKMVKEQNLALNPAKISGICGRLMCCMCFEHNVYHEVWSKLPNPGSKIKTPNGNVVVSGIELQSNSVRCYVPEHGEIKVPVDKFNEFKETVSSGQDWVVEEEDKGINIAPAVPLEENYVEAMDAERARQNEKNKRSGEGQQRSQRRKPRQERQENAAAEKPAEAEKTEHKRRRRPRKPQSEQKDNQAQKQPQAQEAQGENQAGAQNGGEPHKPHRPRRRRGGRGPKKAEGRQEQAQQPTGGED